MFHKEIYRSIRIMSLNVNGFRGESKKEVPDEVCLKNMKLVKKLIDEIIVNENDIVVLQEVPHIIYDDNTRQWLDKPLFDKFHEVFKEYKILKPKLSKKSKQITLALCKEKSAWEQLKVDILQYDNKSSYANKFLELECDSFTLLGLHMPNDEEMWKLLIQALEPKKYTYIIGDFNAYEKRGKFSSELNNIRKCGYNHLIANNILTCYSYNSSIDNIFIDSDFIIKGNLEVRVINTKLTDHALCILEHEY